MLKYFKIILFFATAGLALGTGVFEVTRYANHPNRDSFRFLSADSHEPVYHYIVSKYSDTSRMNYSYSNSKY
jgi:hypothetical protein